MKLRIWRQWEFEEFDITNLMKSRIWWNWKFKENANLIKLRIKSEIKLIQFFLQIKFNYII